MAFLKDSAIATFDDDDVRLMMEAVDGVMSGSDAAKRQWKNEKTGHSGELQTTASFAGPEGIQCKRLRVVIQAGSRGSKSTYTLCDMPPDGWRLVPSDFAPVPKREKP